MENINSLLTKASNPVLPRNIANIDDRIELKKAYYGNIIRATTSDRNKAKSSKALIDSLMYSVEHIAQLVYALTNEVHEDVEHLMVQKVLDIVSETGGMFYKDLAPAVINQERAYRKDDLEFVDRYESIMRYLTYAQPTEDYIPGISSSNAIDIIVYGSTTFDQNTTNQLDEHNITYSKLLSQYLYFIEGIRANLLSDNNLEYFNNVVENLKSTRGVYTYGN